MKTVGIQNSIFISTAKATPVITGYTQCRGWVALQVLPSILPGDCQLYLLLLLGRPGDGGELQNQVHAQKCTKVSDHLEYHNQMLLLLTRCSCVMATHHNGMCTTEAWHCLLLLPQQVIATASVCAGRSFKLGPTLEK
jgi:hypothetical protein